MKTINQSILSVVFLIFGIGQTESNTLHNEYFNADPTLDVHVDYGRALDINAFDTI